MGSRESWGIFHFKMQSKDKPLSWRPLLPYSCEILFDLLISRVGNRGPEIQSHCSRAQPGLQPGLNHRTSASGMDLGGDGTGSWASQMSHQGSLLPLLNRCPSPSFPSWYPCPLLKGLWWLPEQGLSRVGSWCSHFGILGHRLVPPFLGAL